MAMQYLGYSWREYRFLTLHQFFSEMDEYISLTHGVKAGDRDGE